MLFTPPAEQCRPPRSGDAECELVTLRAQLVGLHEHLVLVDVHAADRRVVGLERQEQDLGVLGAQEPPRRPEQLADRLAEVGRALCRAHRLVEELDMLTLLALGHVAAEREPARDDGRDEQQAADGILVDEHDARRDRDTWSPSRRRARSRASAEAAAPTTASLRPRSRRTRGRCRAGAPRPRRRASRPRRADRHRLRARASGRRRARHPCTAGAPRG